MSFKPYSIKREILWIKPGMVLKYGEAFYYVDYVRELRKKISVTVSASSTKTVKLDKNKGSIEANRVVRLVLFSTDAPDGVQIVPKIGTINLLSKVDTEAYIDGSIAPLDCPYPLDGYSFSDNEEFIFIVNNTTASDQSFTIYVVLQEIGVRRLEEYKGKYVEVSNLGTSIIQEVK